MMDSDLLFPARNIQEVLEQLDVIIESSKKNNQLHGYFAALYRKVTRRVAEGIESNEFDDNPRMEKLDVIFANRYLKAYDAFEKGHPCSACWEVAFKATQNSRLIVLQHLLLGMHAHISFDLGIATFQTIENGSLDSIRSDYLKINTILQSMIQDVQKRLAEIWPLFRLLDFAMGKVDEVISGLGIKITREDAWRMAETLKTLPASDVANYLERVDAQVKFFSERIISPPWHFKFALLFVRLTERQSVSEKITILS